MKKLSTQIEILKKIRKGDGLLPPRIEESKKRYKRSKKHKKSEF